MEGDRAADQWILLPSRDNHGLFPSRRADER